MPTKKPRVTWSQFIPDNEWSCYEDAIQVVRKSKAEFLIGGAFGLAVYTGRWRDTKDLDLLIQPRDRDAIVKALSDSGFVDYYDQRAYDRGWIYRATRDGFIVDVIWEMANRRAQVDELWFKFAPMISIRTEKLRVVPAEELLWHKLYVLQRDRCDWPDVLNLLYQNGATLDWDRLLERLGNDKPLLHAVLLVFDWLCPAAAAELPEEIRKQFSLPRDSTNSNETQSRAMLLDSRQWFAGSLPASKKLGN
jgi:hypothetical protein